MLILITIILTLTFICNLRVNEEMGKFFSGAILILWFFWILGEGYCYRGNLIHHQRIDENIALVEEQTKALDEKIKTIEITKSLSLSDSPYKSIIETYNKNMELLLKKKQEKIELENYILISELGMFRHTNKFLVKKELIVKEQK